MPATAAGSALQRPHRAAAAALYAAGFTTAFGAHSIAANLGGYAKGWHESLLALGVLLALYDGAEVLLKPVFGTLADRIGPRPVLLGGLAAFVLFSAAFAAAGDPALVGRELGDAGGPVLVGAFGLISLTAGFGALAAALMVCAALIAPRNHKSPPLPGPSPGSTVPQASHSQTKEEGRADDRLTS